MLTVVHALSSSVIEKLHKGTVIRNKHISYTFFEALNESVASSPM